MKGNNAELRNNSLEFLKNKIIYSYNAGKTMDGKDSYSATIKDKQIGFNESRTSCITTLEFDLVPVPDYKNIVDLKILGKEGTYAKTKRRGLPVVGCWMPYIETDSTDYTKYGCIATKDVDKDIDYIFTIGLGGCTIVATKSDDDGLHFYHEPTKEKWDTEIKYSKEHEVIARVTTTETAGFAMMERKNDSENGWVIHLQNATLELKVGKVSSHNI